jgi:hypothetical protein
LPSSTTLVSFDARLSGVLVPRAAFEPCLAFWRGPEYAALSVRSERRHAMSRTPLRFLLIALLALTIVLSGCGSNKKGGGYGYGVTPPIASVLHAAPAA